MRVLVFGGTRFFGKRLVKNLIEAGDEVFIANRGQTKDEFGNKVQRVVVDRDDIKSYEKKLAANFDVIYDQIGYSPNNAKDFCDFFSGRAGKLIFTSSQSVYNWGAAITENAFDPSQYPIKFGDHGDFNYKEGKRLTEAVYFQTSSFPVICVRFPIVLGEDDYTGRLEFHINKIKNGEPIFFPNQEAKISFIHSAIAGKFLHWLAHTKTEGPLNACAGEAPILKDVMGTIEEMVGKKGNYASSGDEKNSSPFGIEKDWYMDCSKATNLGFSFPKTNEWLNPLIKKLV